MQTIAEERGKRKEERGKRKEERGKRKEERGANDKGKFSILSSLFSILYSTNLPTSGNPQPIGGERKAQLIIFTYLVFINILYYWSLLSWPR